MAEGRAGVVFSKTTRALLVTFILFVAVGGPAEVYFRLRSQHAGSSATAAGRPSQHRLQHGPRLKVRAAGVPTSSSSCPSYRGEYDPAEVQAVVARSGWDLTRHSKLDPACPRLVYAEQNGAAGFGHRLNQWMAALHTAMEFGVTFAHTPFNGGHGRHGNYDGWDGWLNLSAGEWTVEAAREAVPGIQEGTLPAWGGEYMKNEAAHKRHHWGDALKECNRLWSTGMDKWFYDHSTRTKAVVALKYLTSMTEGGGAGQVLAEMAGVFDRAHFNVAVHVRKGDQYPTHERVHAGIIRTTLLPALRQAGVTGVVAVHVFVESADGFMELEGLEGSESTPSLRVTVSFHPDLSPQASLWWMTQADALVMSYSSFSWAAGHLALRPLVYSPRSSDDYRMCTDTFVCCDESGTCALDAHFRSAALARRTAEMQGCGSWAKAAPY